MKIVQSSLVDLATRALRCTFQWPQGIVYGVKDLGTLYCFFAFQYLQVVMNGNAISLVQI